MPAADGANLIEGQPVLPSQERSDLTSCDRELIHTPGSIQPHGMLLSLEENSLVVLQASENVEELLGRPVSDVLGNPLPELLGPTQAQDIIRGLQTPLLKKIPST